MDLSQLSDADLNALSKNDMKSVSDQGLMALHAQAPQPAPEQPSMWKQAGRAAVDSIPMVGGMAGGALGAATGFLGGMGVGAAPGAVVGSGLGYGAGVGIKNAINQYIDPENAPHTSGEAISSVAKGIPVGMAQEVAGQSIPAAAGMVRNAPYIKPFIDKTGQLVVGGFNTAGKWVGDMAEKLAVAATGATGKQASEMAPGTGRALLDNGIVKFGRSQAGIADAANDFLETQGNTISSVLDDLTKQGAVGSKTDLVAGLQAKIDALGSDPAQAQVVKQLESIKADISAGPDAPTLNQVEATKRGFQSMVNYANPEGNAAKAAAADVYRTSAENIASNADQIAAQKFMNAKKLYGQISPAADAATRRAAVTAQSPVGGLGDVMAYGAAGAPGVIAKKAIFPRVNSTMASTANSLSQVLKTSPQMFGKWAGPLTQAAARGEMSLNAADYVLQQTDSDYRQRRQEMNEHSPEDDGQQLKPQSSDEQLNGTSSNYRTK